MQRAVNEWSWLSCFCRLLAIFRGTWAGIHSWGAIQRISNSYFLKMLGALYFHPTLLLKRLMPFKKKCPCLLTHLVFRDSWAAFTRIQRLRFLHASAITYSSSAFTCLPLYTATSTQCPLPVGSMHWYLKKLLLLAGISFQRCIFTSHVIWLLQFLIQAGSSCTEMFVSGSMKSRIPLSPPPVLWTPKSSSNSAGDLWGFPFCQSMAFVGASAC